MRARRIASSGGFPVGEWTREPDRLRLSDDGAVTRNRSAPPSSVTPVLVYPDVGPAVEWLTASFGFVEHVRIGDHRAQLGFGDGALIVADATHGRQAPDTDGQVTHSVMVRVDDVDAHCERARAAGARILSTPTDQPFGERQYAAADPAGHHWTFTQSVVDVPPEQWGGTTVSAW
jgi:uncharacterized glyoxalase superfamily protein PhnB